MTPSTQRTLLLALCVAMFFALYLSGMGLATGILSFSGDFAPLAPLIATLLIMAAFFIPFIAPPPQSKSK